MREFNYDLLNKLVFKYLFKVHHERHFEDCVQYCAMKYLEGGTNIQWNVIDYCRLNGIGDRGKQTARTLEFATLVGMSSDDEDDNENSYLFDTHAVEKFNVENEQDQDKDCRLVFLGRLEEFLLPINLTQEAFKWATSIYQKKLIREKIFNI